VPRNLQTWVRQAAWIAMASMMGSAATAADKPPLKLKRGPMYPARITVRAQSADEDFFDSKLLATPASQMVEQCVPSAAPCDPRIPPTDQPAPEPSVADQAMQPQAGMGNFPQVAPFDFGGGTGGITLANRVPSLIGDFFGTGQSSITITTFTPLGQAVFIDPSLGNTYFREATSFGGLPDVYETGDIVYVGPLGVNPAGDSGLRARDGSGFTGDPSDLGAPTGNNNVSVTPNGAIATTLITNPPESLGILDDVPLYDATQVDETEFTTIIVSPSGGGVVGKSKLTENSSPIPRDRIIFNYSYFDNVPLAPGGVTVNRFTPGFEKTYLNGNASIEMRFPFASTLDPDIGSDGVFNTGETEFGNITGYLKFLLFQDETFALSGGVGIQAPTADDIRLFDSNGTTILKIENDSVHVMPFLGAVYSPGQRFFTQSILQFDFDANGNSVLQTDFVSGLPTGNLSQVGTANDVPFVYWSWSAGYWVYQSNEDRQGLTGLAPIAELHWNRSLGDTDVITTDTFTVGSEVETVSLLNATLGVTTWWGQNKQLTAAYCLPVGGGSDQQFDGEIRVFFNWYFGGPVRGLARGPF
jgi:hypothetical protein